jgi:hypothetical protein
MEIARNKLTRGIVITDRFMIVLGADILLTGLLAKNLERASHA